VQQRESPCRALSSSLTGRYRYGAGSVLADQLLSLFTCQQFNVRVEVSNVHESLALTRALARLADWQLHAPRHGRAVQLADLRSGQDGQPIPRRESLRWIRLVRYLAQGAAPLSQVSTDSANPRYGSRTSLSRSYRNPCNLPGYGNAQAQCKDSSNGILSCTWCSNMGGMGCQATVPTTTAACATVSTANVAASSIINIVGQTNCQCSNTYGSCNTAQSQRGASFVRTYPDA
jgi:hypothetical protein